MFDPNPDNIQAIDGKTITESNLPDAVSEVRSLFEQDFIFIPRLKPAKIIGIINKPIDEDYTIEGEVERVVDNEIIVTVTDHHNKLDSEYSNNKIRIGHEIWLNNYGCEAVDTIKTETTEYGDTFIKAKVFSMGKLYRELIDTLEDHCPKRYRTMRDKIVFQGDGGHVNFIEYVMENHRTTVKSAIEAAQSEPDINTEQKNTNPSNNDTIPENPSTKYST